MSIKQQMHDVLDAMAPHKSTMSTTAYDTAWLARLAELGDPMGQEAQQWLLENQLPEGGWGSPDFVNHYDRLICTLSAMVALARSGQNDGAAWWRRAQETLEKETAAVLADQSYETIGFEMLAPMLVAEARQLGVIQQQGDALFDRLRKKREAKLQGLPKGKISRHVTVAFSCEMAGTEGLDLLDVDNLQEANGSVGHSPSASAYFGLYARPGDPRVLDYLRSIVQGGGVPTVAPSDTFELGWVMWNLAVAGALDDELKAKCDPLVDFLLANWEPGSGIPQAVGYTPKDSDDTSLIYEVLSLFGRQVDIDAVLSYEAEQYFQCFTIESNPSLSANVHVLSALRQGGLPKDHPSVQKVAGFLRQNLRPGGHWQDKWHSSPYYATSHAVIACAGYLDDLAADAVQWMLDTQRSDGSWGAAIATAEETAYCLQALGVWARAGHTVPRRVIQDGVAWLKDHAEPPYPPLWIGKSLYTPVLVTRSVVLGALYMSNGH